jgi:hypothetical protein
VPAKVGRNELVASRRVREDELPIRPVPQAAVQPEQRLAVAMQVVVEFSI